MQLAVNPITKIILENLKHKDFRNLNHLIFDEKFDIYRNIVNMYFSKDMYPYIVHKLFINNKFFFM